MKKKKIDVILNLGVLGEKRFTLWQNEDKQSEKSPDFKSNGKEGAIAWVNEYEEKPKEEQVSEGGLL